MSVVEEHVEEHAPELSVDEERAFVTEATAWLEANAERRPRAEELTWGEGPDGLGLMGGGDDDRLAEARAWRAKVFDAGFGWLGGPVEYGGAGRSPELDGVYRGLEADFDVPDQSAWNVAWEMVAPAVLVHGSEELKQRFLRPIYRGELLCSQLLSEPEAGSDLAGLRTRAVRDGDEWVVNGQKVWSSYAHLADLGQLMARTDPDVPKHQGLTMFLLPMGTPGVEARPLRQMNGNAEFNEVFLTDVRVPDRNRVGEPGSGWRAVLTTLMSERAAVGSAKNTSVDASTVLLELARYLERTSEPLVRQQLAEVVTHRHLLEWLTARAEAAVAAGRERGAEGSIVKLVSSRQNRRIAGVAAELLGPALTADSGEWGTFSWAEYLCSTPGLRIAGGTDEIQHNILGERVLGLPPVTEQPAVAPTGRPVTPPTPPTEQVVPGLWSIPVPIPDNPLGYTLVYLFETSRGPVLVDAGWDADASWDALVAGCAAAGPAIAECYGVLVTHVHPDHHGLSGRVREASGAWIALHERDAAMVTKLSTAVQDRATGRAPAAASDFRDELAAVLLDAGASEHELVHTAEPRRRGRRPRPTLVAPDRHLDDGEQVDVPGWTVEAVWTPGHSPGHTCFRVPDHGLLLAGDHVLPTITPHIAISRTDRHGDPLSDFLDSLAKVDRPDVALVLPAHEHRFAPLHGRVVEITSHHHAHLAAIEALLADGPATLWAIAASLAWNRSWSELSLMMKRAAVNETAAHLRYLSRRDRVARFRSVRPLTFGLVEPSGGSGNGSGG